MRLQSSVDERIAGFVDTYRMLCAASGARILSRKALTIQAVHPFAASITIIELFGRDEWRIRLSGTEICERWGRDKTGLNALASLPGAERAIRQQLVEGLFENPCGLRATLVETYVDGAAATLDTISLPMLGNEGQLMVVSYALVIQDFEHPYGDRPLARRTAIVSHRYVDLGYGTPDQTKEIRKIA